MKHLQDRNQAVYISAVIILVTAGHYLLDPVHMITHNVLQRLYYIPIIWAAYEYGRKGGLLVSVLSGLLYMPHIFITWRMYPEYQVNQLLEIIVFVTIGYSAGLLFEQKADNQRLLQSYEKMALFGSISRTIIRSLKTPIKAIKGMLVALEPMTEKSESLKTCLGVIRDEVLVVENVRNNLIALVERKKLRLKKHNMNEVMFGFMSEIEVSLSRKHIHFTKIAAGLKLSAYINKKAINEALHHLVGIMTTNNASVKEFKIYVGESTSHVWLGGSVQEIFLKGYYLSGLSCLDSDNYHDYNLINVINIMNNHFGDSRFRWDSGNLVEFILVFPKKLKLPWHLKDEPKYTQKSASHSA